MQLAKPVSTFQVVIYEGDQQEYLYNGDKGIQIQSLQNQFQFFLHTPKINIFPS